MTAIKSQGDWWFVAGQIAPHLAEYAAEFGIDWNQVKFDDHLEAHQHEACWSMMQTLWEELPDAPSIRHQPFFDMCDLITENWVFETEMEDEDD